MQQPQYRYPNVRAHCPDCQATTTFEALRAQSGEHGAIWIEKAHHFEDRLFTRIMYPLLRCAGCGRAGLAKVHDSGNPAQAVLETFYPTAIDQAEIPKDTPPGIAAEFREAELCASVSAWRAASALLRSTLEKTLRANGYTKGSLAERIDQAADDGVITEPRRKRAHNEIRVLGNDVLHDDWREVKPDEVEAAHGYAQRILEDFYDDRQTVETILKAKNRIS